MTALLQGIFVGLVISILVGPIFILILEETIKNGKKAALFLVSGIWLSDLIYALTTLLGLHSFLEESEIDYRFGYIVAFILVIIGISSIKTKNKINQKQKLAFARSGNLFLKGFIINTFNPFVVIFWLAVAAKADFKTMHSTQLFYLGLFLTVVGLDLIKILFAHKITVRLKPSHLSTIRAVGGVLLILFGLIMIYRVTQMLQ